MFRAPPNGSREQRPLDGVAYAAGTERPGAQPWRVSRGKLVGAASALVVLVVLALAAFGPIVRGRIAREGARRRLDITIGSVRPGFFAIRLKDVQIRLQGVAGVEVRLDDVRVDLTATFGLREIASHGGEIRVEGEPEDIVERLRAYQKEGKSSAAQPEKGRRPPLAADSLALQWKLREGQLTGSALTLARDDEAFRVAFGHLKAVGRHITLDVVNGEVELGADGVMRRLAAATVTLGQEPSPVAVVAPSPVNATAEPAPPPLPVAPKARTANLSQAKKVVPVAVVVSDEPVLPLPDLHALRTRIATLAQTFGTRIPDGSKVDIGGLAVKLDLGGEAFSFGPGPLTVDRHGDFVHVVFASERASAAATPLAVDAELPLAGGEVTAKLSGGPVSLALLGVKEGTKGLFDVAKGTVGGRGLLVLAAAGDAITFDGQIALHGISMKQPRLATEPLRGVDLAISGRGVLDDGGRLRVDDAQLDVGALHVRTRGTVEETKDHFGVSLAVDVAPAACQALLDSTPQGLLPTVRSARMTGTFGATSRLVFDTRAIDKLVLDYQIDDGCRMVEVPPELSHDRFAGSFTYRTYHPDGTPSETTTGPRTSSWTELEGISPFMVAAVLTTEDGAFYRHHGFNHNAIKSSVAANLKARRFVRGASTISMQLAKNLFLSREKTLSRKIEELILTDYLEQVFRKDDMMELYLNVIEFGPDVYGVTRAAEHYFGRKPEELNLPECFFLASIMPSPIRYGRLRDKGQVSEGWMHHIQSLMEIAARSGKVSRAELAEGLAQRVIFHKAGDARPEPRRPASSGRRDPLDEDAGWQPLE